MNTLSIIIPAYNEEESLRVFLPEVIAFCRNNGYKLIVTNDGSTDGTREILDGIEPEECITVIHHKVNRGYGGAIKSAIRAAETDYVITIDADGQHFLEDIKMLHKKLETDDADMVVGNRDANKQGLYRSMGKNLIRLFARYIMYIPIKDINSGIKIYNTALAKKYLNFCPDSMAYSDAITLVFIAHKHLVVEEPVSLRQRITGTSTITTSTAFLTVLELLNILVLFHPMRVFLPVSVFFMVFGIVWNIPIFLRGEGVSVGSMMLIVSGLLFFLLGLTTEMLANMRRDRVDT